MLNTVIHIETESCFKRKTATVLLKEYDTSIHVKTITCLKRNYFSLILVLNRFYFIHLHLIVVMITENTSFAFETYYLYSQMRTCNLLRHEKISSRLMSLFSKQVCFKLITSSNEPKNRTQRKSIFFLY